MDDEIKLLSKTDLQLILKQYEDNLIVGKKELSFNRVKSLLKHDLYVDGLYLTGIDQRHGNVLQFSKKIDGFVIEFITWDYDFLKTEAGIICKIRNGKINVALTPLNAAILHQDLKISKHQFLQTAIIEGIFLGIICYIFNADHLVMLFKDPIITIITLISLTSIGILSYHGYRLAKDIKSGIDIFKIWLKKQNKKLYPLR